MKRCGELFPSAWWACSQNYWLGFLQNGVDINRSCAREDGNPVNFQLTCGAARTGYRPLADDESLLLIILDDPRRANLRFVRVKPDVAKGTSLA